jgi:hypothetical protein
MSPEDVFGKYKGKEMVGGNSNYSNFETSSAVTTIPCPINPHLARFLRKKLHSSGLVVPKAYKFQRSQY